MLGRSVKASKWLDRLGPSTRLEEAHRHRNSQQLHEVPWLGPVLEVGPSVRLIRRPYGSVDRPYPFNHFGEEPLEFALFQGNPAISPPVSCPETHYDIDPVRKAPALAPINHHESSQKSIVPDSAGHGNAQSDRDKAHWTQSKWSYWDSKVSSSCKSFWIWAAINFATEQTI